MNLFDNEIKYYYFDIGHLENNIYITDLIIYYYKLSDFQQYFAQIKSDSFIKYLSPHLKDIQEKNISLIIDNEGKPIGKIRKLKNIPDFNNITIQSQREFKKNDLNENAKKILKLILYNNQFINRINNSIKEGESNSGYLIKKEFMDEIFKLKIYKIISYYIYNNQNIQNILRENNQNEDYNFIFEKILNEFDIGTINKINQNSTDISIYPHLNIAELKPLKLNINNSAYITNNFLIINDEINKLFSYNSNYYLKDSFNYFYKSKKIFILSDNNQYKNIILMCHMNAQNIIELKLIFSFFNQNSRDYCINQIKELGYDKYQEFLLFTENNKVSPIFDTNQNQIGNAYKYDPTIKDFTQYNINFNIRKIFLLYLNELRLFIKNKNNKFRPYYIINKNWIQKYKSYYKYDIISAEINKNKFIQTNLYNVLNNCENSNINIKDKLIALIIQQLPKNIIDEFNLSDKNFYSFKNEEMKTPNIAQINYNNGYSPNKL